MLTKNTDPYGVYVGVPGKRISERFKNKELEDHIKILQEKSKGRYFNMRTKYTMK